ncbi:autotransporter-associated beta strand repeat-containing protein [Erythrobacter sanguineus]|uniref:Outer membrane autotransporter barrel domain-containing protein n=1 Tax=Erythrobacter sanguineus TaxID=198312 RepID=A0A1M7T2A3_9SPHN|nr:autotransporter-associated beta strand repeat-containing protein [Erythrobacter sanguineus]SHN64792.1 outer membrane autotransporter barrel domain-containing protein [Erythrobacter sanguineus]
MRFSHLKYSCSVIAACAASTAFAEPAVFFNDDRDAGRTTFRNTVQAADANAGQTSVIYEIDILNTTGSIFQVTNPTNSDIVFVRTTRVGAPALNNGTGDLGGDGFTNWGNSYSPDTFAAAAALGYNIEFFSDASLTNPFQMNSLGLHVNNWGTCCATNNATPSGGTSNASEIYLIFDNTAPLLLGGIASTIPGTEHFIGAINDTNFFSRVNVVANGDGEFFGAGGFLTFTSVALNSVPSGSSVVSGTGLTPSVPVIPDIDTAAPAYTVVQLAASQVNPNFVGGTLRIGTSGTVSNAFTVQSQGGTIDTDGNTINLSGSFSGVGRMTKGGAGVLNLTASSSHSGGFFIQNGALGVSNIAQIGTGSLEIGAGTLLANGDFAANRDLALSSASSTIDVQANSVVWSGIVSGTGNLNVTGSGVLVLGGINTYSGETVVNPGGSISLASADALGATSLIRLIGDPIGTVNGRAASLIFTGSTTVGANIVADGDPIIDVATGEIVTLAGDISDGVNPGDIVKVGAGRLILTGANTYTGGTIVSAGELIGNTTSLQGAIANNAAVEFAQATGGTYAGVMSGSGTLTKTGAGALTLTGANTYAGGTTISGGVLQLGGGAASGSITGPVVNNGALAVNRSDTYTFAGVISGTGIFVQDGTGTTTLTAANTYTGGTLISRGRLVGNTTSLQGAIQNNSVIEFAQATTGTFADQISGTGRFDKTGAGMLTLTANSASFTGDTFVQAGELRVNGNLSRSVTSVESGARLSGTGVIGGLVANSGSVISPGNSPGVLNVDGAVNLQSGSTVEFEVSATGPIDQILATGAAEVDGTAAITNLGGIYAFNSEYLLLEADGGRTGTFADATGLAGFGILYRPELVYTDTQVRLRMAPNLLANIVGSTVLTSNQRSVVNLIDGAVTAGYNPQPLFNIYSLPVAQMPGAFDQLSGEVYATAAGVGIEQERLVRDAVLGRLGSVAMAARDETEAGSGVGVWGQLFGGWGNGDSDRNAAAFETDRMGMVTGIDVGKATENSSWRAGIFGMQVQSDVTIDRLGSTAEVEQAGGGVYASLQTGRVGIAIGGYLTEIDLRAFRDIRLPGFAETNVGTTEGKAKQAFAELSYTIPSGSAIVRPFLAGSIGSFKLDGMTETGGEANLTMLEQDYSTATLTGGIDAMVPIGKSLSINGAFAGRAQLGDRDPQAFLALAAAPQQAFAISGAQLDEFALVARLDARFSLDDKLQVSVGYTGLSGITQTDHSAQATIQVRF